MPNDAPLTPRVLIGKVDVLHVECPRCYRRGAYRVDQLFVLIGPDAKLTDWVAAVTADCPFRAGSSDHCDARCPEILSLAPQ